VTQIRVPLAVDAQVRVPFGPALLPMRAIGLIAIASPIALLCLGLSPIPITYRVGVAVSVLMLAFTLAVPTREGVWIGCWATYRVVGRWLPCAVVRGACCRASVRMVAGAVEVGDVRAPLSLPRGLRTVNRLSLVPSASTVEPGVIKLTPGGTRGLLGLEGPTGSVGGESYAAWCRRVITWLLAIECPAQLLAVLYHYDSQRARISFDRRTTTWPRTPLLELERELAGALAEQSLRVRHYVVLSPGTAGTDGVPCLSSVIRARRHVEANPEESSRALRMAMRLAAPAGLEVTLLDRDDIAGLLSHSVVGAGTAAKTVDGLLQVGDEHDALLAVTDLPPVVHPGMVMEALMRNRARGVASLHVMRVDAAVARKALDRRLAMQRYTAREGNDGVDNQVAVADTTATLAALARRDLQPCRVALTLSLGADTRQEAIESAERVGGYLHGLGFRVSAATSPGFLPALAASPGGAPLGRSLRLTSHDVAACLVPALGTPFADDRQAIVGLSEVTGAPVHLSVWSRPNQNAIVVGSSGAGKSATAKTLLVRHVMEGASAVVIDPDSEYRRVMQAIGGCHVELGDDALNPLSVGGDLVPEVAAGLVLPVLSVMAGDDRGMRDGRPVRRMPDEDQGWLFGELAAFFGALKNDPVAREPVMSDLVRFIETVSTERALTPRETDRCRLITARLRRYTQGDRARVFDRPSTFRVGSRPIAVGLRQLAMSYVSDLTPALAVILTAVLAALAQRDQRLLVIVDEAHRVTGDPDAGAVLGQLVRQARKYNAGVWMCSQRAEDFVGTDLGRTLAATAATKVVMGVEEAALSDVKDVFALTIEEASAISPPVTGRAVLISGAERTVLRVIPGPGILALANAHVPLERLEAERSA
jgi:Helicase HerA, central domain